MGDDLPRPLTSRAKKTFDRVAGALGIALSSPLWLLTAIAIRLEDGPGVLFRQTRLGMHAQHIRVAKFRSMKVNDIDPTEMGQVDNSNPLVTRTGRVIRRLKIDELPQLLGVLSGDLSVVGPRPTLVEQLDGYDDFQRRRLEVKPGLTGWAQVNGGTAVTWEDRIRLDVWYIDNWSFWLDIRILFRTVAVVLLGERRNDRALADAALHEQTVRATN